MPGRRLSADEAALWARVMASVRPLTPSRPPAPISPNAERPDVPPKPRVRPAIAASTNLPALGKKHAPRPANTLDGSWDRQLTRGLAVPDRTIDLHGHTLASAYAMLDSALERAIAAGDRVILLVTGKPPRPTSERPHARGAIRVAVGDWLAGSRHAGAIAAVRGAHPRHGGAGALYIVLRRARSR